MRNYIFFVNYFVVGTICSLLSLFYIEFNYWLNIIQPVIIDQLIKNISFVIICAGSFFVTYKQNIDMKNYYFTTILILLTVNIVGLLFTMLSVIEYLLIMMIAIAVNCLVCRIFYIELTKSIKKIYLIIGILLIVLGFILPNSLAKNFLIDPL